ncbi:bleomycin resistance family protein [Subtercola boreus]|uniref:Bleomycin resistance protein n=1 Tax=Subtercola boreus TaxID=120213 RepID=A0A3E0W593_9MICO|nr:bleomycin resistance family protein [Subtercola boreus]
MDFAPSLVPELLVTNLDQSIEFWSGRCGFGVKYARPEERFAYLVLGTTHVMLEQAGVGRNWLTGPLDQPLGRGVNFQITVPDVDTIVASLAFAEIELFMEPETKWYRTGDEEAGVRQFLVSDPDGYLLRFQSSVGRRTAAR